MLCKKAAIKQPVPPQSLRESSQTYTSLAKRIHFEKTAKIASAPQIKKRKGCEVRAHDWAKQQTDKKAANCKKR